MSECVWGRAAKRVDEEWVKRRQRVRDKETGGAEKGQGGQRDKGGGRNGTA